MYDLKAKNNKKCCVIGLGYIGLPTAAILAANGYEVIGVDTNELIVSSINNGKSKIIEKDLKALVNNVIKNGNFRATNIPSSADIYIICVPTPIELKLSKNNKPIPNIDYVLNAARSIAKVVRPGNVIIIESTCPVGTTEKVASLIETDSKILAKDLLFAYCPERVLPGSILKELTKNDRIVGGMSQKSSNACKKIYSSFCNGNIHITDSRTAELTKLVENSYRDINLAFANEISMISAKFKINVRELIKLTNNHPRVNILQPGCGVGGHCIAIDPWFIASALPNDSQLIQTAREINKSKEIWVRDKIIDRVNEIETDLNKVIKIACLGITFKPDVDDLRESPALNIVKSLLKKKYDVIVCEPNIKSHEGLEIYPLEEAIKKADLIIFLVSHSNFIGIDTSNLTYLDFCGITS
ncbi:UDP-N-acetyl-D-mannosamine dehydrogenase [bacterium]|nr:UDP-N-acetyl-D-mannosamine dehydrogenase [bacterium]|tara:strand:+ start:2400 stop:3638 length:1239 start_codon:yes stop_codon:yes gene_type:complete